jgi:hypothetical protein
LSFLGYYKSIGSAGCVKSGVVPLFFLAANYSGFLVLIAFVIFGGKGKASLLLTTMDFVGRLLPRENEQNPLRFGGRGNEGANPPTKSVRPFLVLVRPLGL